MKKTGSQKKVKDETATYLPRMKDIYNVKVSLDLHQEFKYESTMQIPKLEKIVVSMGVGEAVKDSKKLDLAVNELTAISGQKPVVTKAKKANASFKLSFCPIVMYTNKYFIYFAI